MRILVCGDRNYTDWAAFEEELREWLIEEPHCWINCAKPSEITIIEGGARGVDTLAKEFAIKYGMAVKEYPADWDKYGKAAGPIRNKQMLDEGKPDLVIAFLNSQHSRGTKNMIEQATKAGIEVKVINI